MRVHKIVRSAVRKEAMPRLIDVIESIGTCGTEDNVTMRFFTAKGQIDLLRALGVITDVSADRLINYAITVSALANARLKAVKQNRFLVYEIHA